MAAEKRMECVLLRGLFIVSGADTRIFAFTFYSGHAEDVAEQLDRGLLDFGICIEPANMSKYDLIKLPTTACGGKSGCCALY
ncbi:MAG: hypothetical protein NC548_37365 [Lachnospiraceae bacterium]|nr:hypothetical protein [Lachnospiraceae bacterium]MCM1230810.1 hypothetical protein [Ruminococcus flavefaciens]